MKVLKKRFTYDYYKSDAVSSDSDATDRTAVLVPWCKADVSERNET